ncbi:MAG: hypothetical protein IJO20_04905 [Ruminococcus sp.]|nr:hypothetical protein [Ruminococcus sp.]
MMNIFKFLHHNKKGTKENTTPFEYKNNVTIAGRVVNKFATDKVTILTIGVYKNVANFPKVLFFGDNCKKAAQFNNGDMVKIDANIQSSRIEPGKNQRSVSVFGDSIERMDDSCLKDFYDATYSINRIEVSGDVTDVVNWNNVQKIRIRTYKNNRVSCVPVDYYNNGNSQLDVKVGDKVSVMGIVQTRKKLLDNKAVYFENYVARKIIVHDVSYSELETA